MKHLAWMVDDRPSLADCQGRIVHMVLPAAYPSADLAREIERGCSVRRDQTKEQKIIG